MKYTFLTICKKKLHKNIRINESTLSAMKIICNLSLKEQTKSASLQTNK